jgi:hypothetical protein
LGPLAREQDPKQPIPKAKARAPSSAALEHSNLMAQRDRLQHQRGSGPGVRRFGPPGMIRSPVSPPMHRMAYPQLIETTNEFARINF